MLPTGRQTLVRRILSAQLQKWQKLGCNITTTACCKGEMNLYNALGIPKSSTQSEIKSAYYKLSMQYHPDKNQGCQTAAQKFREITKAYEVLGNYKLRRLYDKGVGVDSVEVTIPRHDTIVPEDDDETKFYKSRFRKSTVTAEGQTPIYDFDEWSRAHYGKSFQRRQTAKNTFERKENEKRLSVTSLQNEFVLFGLMFLVIAGVLIFRVESSYDTPAEHEQRKAQNNTGNND